MPPQPLCRVSPHPIGPMRFEPQAFDRHPEIALNVAKCVAAWADVEWAWSSIFVQLVGENKHMAAAMWNEFQSDKLKKESFRSICASVLQANDFDIIKGMLKMLTCYSKTRNMLVHWKWGWVDSAPNGLILVDPKHFLVDQGRIGDAMLAWERDRIRPSKDKGFGLPDAEIFFYRKSDSENDFEKFTATRHILMLIAVMLDLKDAKRTEARDHLKTRAHLRPFLS